MRVFLVVAALATGAIAFAADRPELPAPAAMSREALEHEVARLRVENVAIRALCGGRCRPRPVK